MEIKNTNANGVDQSLQVSRIGNIPSGENFTLDMKKPFLIKNTSEENIIASVKLANMDGFIDTIFYPGWNPELVIEVVVDSTFLQYGN